MRLDGKLWRGAVVALPLLAGCAGIAGQSLASPELQRDTRQSVLSVDAAARKQENVQCRTVDVVSMEVIEPARGPRTEGGQTLAGAWVERWTVDRCGTRVPYRIEFVPQRVGTRMIIEREKP